MEAFMGTVVPMAFNYAPYGWFSCNGQTLPIAQYSALFALLGTMYGGDGVQTFGLPDLRGRSITGQGQGPGLSGYQEGQKAGSENYTLTVNQMPNHTHVISVAANSRDQGTGVPTNNYLGGGTTSIYSDQAPDAVMNTAEMTCAPQGSGIPFSLLNPICVMSYNICAEGLFPQRP